MGFKPSLFNINRKVSVTFNFCLLHMKLYKNNIVGLFLKQNTFRHEISKMTAKSNTNTVRLQAVCLSELLFLPGEASFTYIIR